MHLYHLWCRHFHHPATAPVLFADLGESERDAWEGLARELSPPGEEREQREREAREKERDQRERNGEHPFGARGHSTSVADLIQILRAAPPEMKVVLQDQKRGWLFSPCVSTHEPAHDPDNPMRKTDASFYGEKVVLLGERISPTVKIPGKEMREER